MENTGDLKKAVKDKYGKIAQQSSCCCCKKDRDNDSVFSEDYNNIEGYTRNADLGLGCGIPTEYADIHPGDHVLDLGSGAGNDCFVARAITGDTGRVTGLDFTEEMIRKAITNNHKLGYSNVEFIKGDIDDMPFDDGIFNVIISNCVLNLVPDKEKVFSEMYRVLKNGSHFCISDIVLHGRIPDPLKKEAEQYAGCVATAIQKENYLNMIVKSGFKEINVRKQKSIELPDEMLRKHLSSGEYDDFKNEKTGIFSITVTGKKF